MTTSYNVQHSPMGAFSSFTLGNFGTRGGFGTQQGRPGGCNVFVGYRRAGEVARFLPFFEEQPDARRAFDPAAELATRAFDVIPTEAIRRELKYASDTWTSGPIQLRICSPFFEIPDPARANAAELKRACCPVVFAELSIDNRAGDRQLSAMFAVEDSQLRELHGHAALRGIANRNSYGLAFRPDEGVHEFLEFTALEGFKFAGKRLFRLGKTGGVVVHAAAGEQRKVVVALGFHQPGIVTTGIETRYWYERYFRDLEAVLEFGLANYGFYEAATAARDRELDRVPLTPAQKFLIAQGAHSYYGSTQWLDRGDQPLWVVNEGEYEMMNTLDLMVDQMFFELKMAPWAVRNQLDFFVERYSYRDRVRRHGERDVLHAGGISFCHDQGVSNQFAPPGTSAYETRDLPGTCFSFMTQEQLTNWVCGAGVYVKSTHDGEFLRRHAQVLADCLTSLLNRDDPEPARRDGIMSLDTARAGEGWEITTYDSLDPALGQARSNLYLATKTWAAYVSLRELFTLLGEQALAHEAGLGAHRAARSIAERFDDALGYIPGIFEAGNESAIIPAIEGLIYPHAMGLHGLLEPEGEFGGLVNRLREHLAAVLVPGRCLFPDGGWKLSSTSDISWVSKIAICQHVARVVLGVDVAEPSHRAHERWLKEGAAYFAATDQFERGTAVGSRFYPRLVSNVLWLDEPRAEGRKAAQSRTQGSVDEQTRYP